MEIEITAEVEAYIKGLSSITEKAQISQYLDRQAELGHRLKEPVSKPLGMSINEIRPGPHRLLFFYHGRMIIVIHAFRKKSAETPHYELEAAVRIRDEWMRRHA